MSVYLMRLLKQGRANLMSIPATWRKEHFGPDDRYVFAVETAQGTLELFSERSYYEQKFSKFKSPRDTGAGEVDQGKDRPEGGPGTCGELEEAWTTAADIGQEGIRRLQD